MSFSDSILPCNRGIPNNYSTRGWHKFVAGPYGTVCEYCGTSAQSTPAPKWNDNSYTYVASEDLFPDPLAPDGGARQGQDER